jgi:adenylosuccinate synthase
MKTSFVVIGLGFGDEGKGLTTDYLCLHHPDALVVRFSGGHQAGHTVALPDGQRHVFSSFGSGTLRGNPSYWSSYCTLYPSALLMEYAALQKMGKNPRLFVDARTMITTPYDVAYNRAVEKINNHGSCGAGVGPTIERNELSIPYKFYAQDMLYPAVAKHRLEVIHRYYQEKAKKDGREGILGYYLDLATSTSVDLFLEDIGATMQIADIVAEPEIFHRFATFIFEGSQGILLDQNYGLFPHVTRTNTTSQNAMDLIKKHNLGIPDVYYITRAYLTRHGNGPMSNEGKIPDLVNIDKETNVLNDWQGNFRRALLDLDMINYALQCDANYTALCPKHLMVTCLDQLKGRLTVTANGRTFTPHSFEEIIRKKQIYAADFKSLIQNSADHINDSIKVIPLDS